MGAYLTALAGRGVTTVLLRPGEPVFDAGDRVAVVHLPAGIDEVLGAGGLGPVGGTTGAAVLEPDGTIREPITGTAPHTSEADPWDDGDPWREEPRSSPMGVGRMVEDEERVELSGSGPRAGFPFGESPPGPTRPGDPWAAANGREPPIHALPAHRTRPVAVDDDPWEVFDAGPVHRPAPGPGHRVTDRRADVVFVFSGKGGVGKTSVALGLAQRAGTRLRVVLVDANRGQGDIRTYLRLTRSTLPTIWAAASTRR